MIKLSMLYTGKTKAVNGASKVVNCFNEYKHIFEELKIDFGGVFELGSENDSEVVLQKKKNSNWKNKIVNLLKMSFIGNVLSVKKFWFGNANRVVNKYICSNRQDDILVFHDFFSCHSFINSYKGTDMPALILVLHNDGDVWKMFLDYYSKLRNTFYERFLNKLSDKVLNKIDAVVFVSDTSRENFCKLNPGFRQKAKTIHNGIETRELKRCGNCDKLEIVTVGSVCERKRQKELIEAIAVLDYEDIGLTIVGNGPEFEICKNVIKENRLEGRVRMLGSRSDVADILDKCNCFALISSSEGLPIAGIEALRSGLPMLLTDVGGNRELIDNNGILISLEKSELISAIRSLYNGRDKLFDMGDNSRSLFEKRYSVNSMLIGYCNLAKEICSGEDAL